MSYSKKHNILFIHIPKCAGKSFEVVFDIVTKKETKQYKFRTIINRFAKFLLFTSRDKKSLDRLWGTFDISLALQHLTYVEIEVLNLLNKQVLNSSIKMAVVRNPYDRAVSSYLHFGAKYKNFLDFVSKYYQQVPRDHNDLSHKRTQLSFLRDSKGNVIVDNIIRFENMNEDYERLKLQYKLNFSKLPHIGKQRKSKSYHDYYCSESKSKVESLFKEDIEYFNYSFH